MAGLAQGSTLVSMFRGMGIEPMAPRGRGSLAVGVFALKEMFPLPSLEAAERQLYFCSSVLRQV